MEEQQKKSALVIVNGVLIDGSKAQGKIIVPDSVTAVGDDAFFDNCDLEEIILPDSVKSIGRRAFYFCNSLSQISLPKNLTSIGDWV